MRLKGPALLPDYDAPMWLIWEMWVKTDKVDNIVSQRLLPSKFVAADLALPEVFPWG